MTISKSDESEIYDTVCQLYIQKFKHYVDESSGYIEFLEKNPKEGIFIAQCLMCRRVVSCNVDITGVITDGKPTVDVIIDEDEPECCVKPPTGTQ